MHRIEIDSKFCRSTDMTISELDMQALQDDESLSPSLQNHLNYLFCLIYRKLWKITLYWCLIYAQYSPSIKAICVNLNSYIPLIAKKDTVLDSTRNQE